MLDSFFKGLAATIGDIFANYFVSLNDVMTLANLHHLTKLMGFHLWHYGRHLKDYPVQLGQGLLQ